MSQIHAQERIADVQAQAQITSTTITGQASKDVAGIGAEADKYKTDADKEIATVQSNTALSIADKEQATAQIKITAEINIALDNIRSAETMNGANNAKDIAITNLNNSMNKSIADIQANTALSVEDKRSAVANIQAQTQLAIATADNASKEKISLDEIKGSKDITFINTKSNELMASAKNNSDQAIATLDANTNLSLADKDYLKTQLITTSNESIAGIEATTAIAQMANAVTITDMNNISNKSIARIQKGAAESVARINQTTALSEMDKQKEIAKINTASNQEIARLESRTELSVAVKNIQGAKDIAEINTKSAEAINLINARKDMNINALQLRNDLTLAEKEKERTNIIKQSNEDIAAANNLSEEKRALLASTTSENITKMSTEAQKYISDSGLTEQIREFDINVLAQKAKDMNTYQRKNPVTGVPETITEPWAVTIAREQMKQELAVIDKTEMQTNPDGTKTPRWQVELNARIGETMIDGKPVAYAIAQDQFNNIITTTNMNNDANWEQLGRQIDSAYDMKLIDANTERSVAANALAQRAKESTDAVEQQEYQNMVDLITNPAVVAYMEKNPAKDIMGDAIITLLQGAFTGEGITINADQLIARMQQYEITATNKEELDTAFEKYDDITIAPNVTAKERDFESWAKENLREAGLVARYYFSRTGNEAPDYIKKYEEVGMTPEERANREKLEELYGEKPQTQIINGMEVTTS